MPARSVRDVAALLDHAVLKPNFTAADLAAQAAMCVARGVGCLCVRPCDVAAAARHVAGSPVVVASVIGFPHGSHRPETKALEARLAVADGARELDMVLAIHALLSGEESRVRDDIAAVVAEARPHGALVKVIFETCYLSPAQIVMACRLSEEAGADFVKTSTGFGTGGATPEAVRLMLDTVGGRLAVKASGGIRTWDDAVMYLDMGCKRLGVGDAATILDGGTVTGAY
ncbi:MAG: deoxyribose-phosphate aldolase [Planctomycetia bacterium]